MCACKHLQTFTKKHEHSIFTPFLSKNDYDKPKVKNINDCLQCEGWNTQKLPIVLQYAKH